MRMDNELAGRIVERLRKLSGHDEDLLADTLEGLVRSSVDWSQVDNPEGYALTALRNQRAQRARSAARQKLQYRPNPEDHRSVISDYSQGTSAPWPKMADAMRALESEFDPQTLEAFLEYYFGGETWEELANKRGVPRSTLQGRVKEVERAFRGHVRTFAALPAHGTEGLRSASIPPHDRLGGPGGFARLGTSETDGSPALARLLSLILEGEPRWSLWRNALVGLSGASLGDLLDTIESVQTIDDDLNFVQEDLQGIFPGTYVDRVQRVLIVDDEPYVLRAIQRLLRDQALEVVTAPNAQVALNILGEQEVSLIIADQFMSGMSGTDLLAHAQQRCPDTVRVMLTGNNDLTTAIEAINQGDVFRFITKPWRNDELLRVIELGLGQYDLHRSHRLHQEFLKNQNASLSTLNSELERRVAERTELLAASERRIQRLYQDLQESFDAALGVMLSVMELGDIHIVDHCQRTASLVQEFCGHLGLSPLEAKPVVRAALLHWIGLISAPPGLLLRERRDFAPEEEAAWEFHPVLGYQALLTVPALERSGLIILKYLTRADDVSFCPGAPLEGLDDVSVDESLVRSCGILHICSTFERCRTRLKRRGDRDLALVFEHGLRELRLGKGTVFEDRLVEHFDEFVVERFLSRRAEVHIPSVAELHPRMILSRPLSTLRGVPVAPRELELTPELIDRLQIFEQTGGLDEIFVWV